MSKSPTRKDVAKRAGVSTTIVSYVLNDNRYVKKEKRERVLEAVKELGYKPNRFARALKGKKSKHIVFLADRMRSEFHAELINDIGKFSGELDYLVSVSVIINSKEYINKIISWQIDAVIISSIKFKEELIQLLIDAGISVILFKNRQYKNIKGATIINTGLYEGVSMAVKHMYDEGCRKIVYIDRISTSGNYSNMSDFRYCAYHDVMKEIGLESQIKVITGCENTQQLEEKIVEYMREYSIDGIMGRTDYVTRVCMSSLIKKGYKIPEDVSCVGVNNSSYSQISLPQFTSLALKRREISKYAIEIIEKISIGENIVEEKLFIPDLIVRESTMKKGVANETINIDGCTKN